MLISHQPISPVGLRNKQPEEIWWGDRWWAVLEGIAVRVIDPYQAN